MLGPLINDAIIPAYAAPARSPDYSRLPPAFIDVGSAELFRDEAIAFAQEVWKAGGEAELHVWPGGTHGYDVVAPSAAISIATTRARLRWIQRTLSRARA